MKYPLTHGEKIPVIERTLSFFAKFATSVKSEEQEQSEVEKKSDEEDEDDIDPFLVAIFEFLLKVILYFNFYLLGVVCNLRYFEIILKAYVSSCKSN